MLVGSLHTQDNCLTPRASPCLLRIYGDHIFFVYSENHSQCDNYLLIFFIKSCIYVAFGFTIKYSFHPETRFKSDEDLLRTSLDTILHFLSSTAMDCANNDDESHGLLISRYYKCINVHNKDISAASLRCCSHTHISSILFNVPYILTL